MDPTFKLDVRYATTKNISGQVLYDEPRVFLQRPAAEAFVKVHQALKAEGYGIVLFDGYHPWSATKVFWDISGRTEGALKKNLRREVCCDYICKLMDVSSSKYKN